MVSTERDAINRQIRMIHNPFNCYQLSHWLLQNILQFFLSKLLIYNDFYLFVLRT